MPNPTPTPRLDVATIAARAEDLLTERHAYLSLEQLLKQDIPALIAHIEALEAVVKAARELEPAVRGMPMSYDGLVQGTLDLARQELNKALAALGDGDG